MAHPPSAQPLLAGIDAALQAGREPIVIFDLDGTLYDNNHRMLRILHEFASSRDTERPDLVEGIARLGVADIPYRIGDALVAAGFDEPALLADVVAFWKERFFYSPHIHYDLPVPGAVHFVKKIAAAGAVPTYLTGRDAPNMLVGTIEALQRDGFPVGTVGTRVVLKEAWEISDEVFKRGVVQALRRAGTVVGVFDNEPPLCNMFQEAYAEAAVFHVAQPHAPGAPALHPNITVIPDFRPLL